MDSDIAEPGPSYDIHDLAERKFESGGLYEHLQAWINSADKQKAFTRQCKDALLQNLEHKPRLRPDGKDPQLLV